MRIEAHLDAFEERKETIFKWGLEIRGIEKSQRIVGDNASKAIVELLSAYLHKTNKIDEGFQLNHSWFKSEKILNRLPEFESKNTIVEKMIILENYCESLSYGISKPVERIKDVIKLFNELEESIKENMK